MGSHVGPTQWPCSCLKGVTRARESQSLEPRLYVGKICTARTTPPCARSPSLVPPVRRVTDEHSRGARSETRGVESRSSLGAPLPCARWAAGSPPPGHRLTPIGKALPPHSVLSGGITGRTEALDHRIGAPLPLRALLADGRIPAGARLRVSVFQSPESPRGEFATAPLQASVATAQQATPSWLSGSPARQPL